MIDRVQKELETEFIPDVYDKTMAKMFNERYYEDEVDEDEHDIEANKAIDLKLLQDRGDQVEEDAHEYLEQDVEKAKEDFENKMGKSVAEKAQGTAQQ